MEQESVNMEQEYVNMEQDSVKMEQDSVKMENSLVSVDTPAGGIKKTISNMPGYGKRRYNKRML